MQTGLQHGMLPLLKPSVSAVSLNPQSSLFLPSCLTSLQSLWQILADRGPAGREVWNKRKVEGGKKLYILEKLSSKSAGAVTFPRGRCSLPGLPGGVWKEGVTAICALV